MPRDKVFISYSHKDTRWREELEVQLKPYVRGGSIVSWSDEQIARGSKWFGEIKSALAQTKVAVLLVTPDFLASDFIHEHELGPLLKEAEQGGVKILWVPVHASAYKQTLLKNYQAVLDDPGKPLAGMTKAKRDQAWVKVCEEIEKAVNPSAPKEPDFSSVREVFFKDNSTELKTDVFPVKYNETMLDDLARVLAEIRSKRVLFADLNHELWMFVFPSLKNILSGLVSVNGTIQRKGPNDVKQCVEQLIDATKAYLADYEADYARFMEGPWLRDLADSHKERNWPALGDAAEDLIRLRRMFGRALKNLAAFAHEGKILLWTEEESRAVEESIRAEKWSEFARNRKLCSACGWNLNYRRVKCPYDHSMCPSFDPSETAFEYEAYGARVVEVAGSFSGWQPISLEQLEYGKWATRVRIPPGVYQYKFIVDGQWQTDPRASVESDSAGNMNSVLFVRES